MPGPLCFHLNNTNSSYILNVSFSSRNSQSQDSGIGTIPWGNLSNFLNFWDEKPGSQRRPYGLLDNWRCTCTLESLPPLLLYCLLCLQHVLPNLAFFPVAVMSMFLNMEHPSAQNTSGVAGAWVKLRSPLTASGYDAHRGLSSSAWYLALKFSQVDTFSVNLREQKGGSIETKFWKANFTSPWWILLII